MPNEFVLKELSDDRRFTISKEDELEILKFSIEKSHSSIDMQAEILNSLRNRASSIIALNGAILILSRNIFEKTYIVPRNTSQTLSEWAAENVVLLFSVSFFALAVLLCLLVLNSKGGWRFTSSGEKIIRKYVESGQYESLKDIYRDYISVCEKNVVENNQKLNTMHRRLFAAICSTMLHALSWIIGGVYG